MRLEVKIGKNAPTIYLIENQVVYIGTRDTNDIVIKSSEISGKHVKLSFQDKTCFISDMGSTNGTFFNDEQLVPGRNVEVPPDEPIMLGHQVTLRLLPELVTIKQGSNELTVKTPKKGEATAPTPEVVKGVVPVNTSTLDMSDRTRVISLKEMKKAETVRQNIKREKIKQKKRQESKRMRAEKDSFKRVSILAGTWLVLGMIGHFAWQSFSMRNLKKNTTKQVAVDRVILDGSLEDKESIAISPDLLHPRELLLDYLKKPKCRTSLETVFCSRMDHSMMNSGVVMLTGDLIFYIQENRWMEKARGFIRSHTNPDLKPEKRVADDESLRKLALLHFMHQSLGKNLPQNFKPRFFYFVFYSLDNAIVHYSVFRPELLPSFALKADREWAKLDKQNGFLIIDSLFSLIGHHSN